MFMYVMFFEERGNERFLKALEVTMHIPSPCLDASKSGLLLEFIAQKRGSNWL